MKIHLVQGNKCVTQSVQWLVLNTNFTGKRLYTPVNITGCKSFSVYVWFQCTCLNLNLWLCFTWNVKQRRWGGSDSLLVSSVASEQKEGSKVGKEMGCGGGCPPPLRPRFGDITEQHESLECVLNLCSQGHAHLRGRPALVYVQRAVWRHVAPKWWSGCRRGQESWAGETERARFQARGGRIFTLGSRIVILTIVKPIGAVKMTESGSNRLFLSTLETWDMTVDIYLHVQTVCMCFCRANCSKTVFQN